MARQRTAPALSLRPLPVTNVKVYHVSKQLRVCGKKLVVGVQAGLSVQGSGGGTDRYAGQSNRGQTQGEDGAFGCQVLRMHLLDFD